MIQYYAIIGIVLLCWIIFENQKKETLRGGAEKGKMPLFVLLLIAAMTFVAGFRYRVGTDYIAYSRIYNNYLAAPLLYIFETKEVGSFILAKIAGFIYHDYVLVFFLFALLISYYNLRTIGRWANDICFGVLLYLFMGCFHVSFNAVRQCLAAAIVFAGHRHIVNQKIWKYLLVCVIAAMFHISALFMIVPYFIATRKINKIQLLLFLGIMVAGWFSYEGLIRIAALIRDNPEIRTIDYSSHSIHIFRVLVAWAPVVMMFVLKGKRKWEDIPEMDADKKFFFNMLLFNAAIVTATMNSAYLARLFIYTNLYAAIGIPLVVELIPKKNRKWLVILIIVLYLIYWYVEAQNLSHFRWIWNRPIWDRT